MSLIILFILVSAGLIALLVWQRVKENRYLKKTTKEVISKGLREELERERKDAVRRKERFERTLNKHKF